MSTHCRHCGRIIMLRDGSWVDPEPTGDDAIWADSCDAHDTFIADHEPEELCEAGCGYPLTEGRCTNPLCPHHWRIED